MYALQLSFALLAARRPSRHSTMAALFHSTSTATNQKLMPHLHIWTGVDCVWNQYALGEGATGTVRKGELGSSKVPKQGAHRLAFCCEACSA